MTRDGRITLLVFGTRGEVQPMLVLGLGLQDHGYDVRMITQADFYDFVSGHGLPCVPIEFDLRRVEKTRSEEGTYGLLTVYRLARQTARQCFVEIWNACKDSDALILCDMGIIPGWHLMEKLQIPTYVVNICPEEISRKLWNASFHNRLGTLKQNVIFSLIFWLVLKPLINDWRTNLLGLPRVRTLATSSKAYAALGVPMLYAYSPSVAPKQESWPDTAYVTGYWFLEKAKTWKPPDDLAAFLAAGPPPVYVGFSSVSFHDMEKMTDTILTALKQTNQRGILASGWSNLGKRAALPDDFLVIEGAPHDWLFPQTAAAIHHGGMGTTGIALRSGIPNIIIPFAFDNPFWAWRIEALGLGVPAIPPRELTVQRLAEALDTVLHDEDMRARREGFSRQIQAEDGVARAIEVIEHYLYGKIDS